MKKIIIFCTLLFSLVLTANAAEGDYIIKYRDDLDFVRTYSDCEDEVSLGLEMYLVPADKALALQEAGYLEACEPDVEMFYHDDSASFTPPNDLHYQVQWNLHLIKATYPWSRGYYGDDVIVGIIDSGLAPNHPDIDYTRVIEGYNFGANNANTTDVSGHGTYCAGVIAAKSNNGIGMAGVADKVKILPMKVENDSGKISMSSVINAINAGAGYGCDVINISLGSGSNSTFLEEAITNATNKGVIVVCAAGNDTSSDPGDHVRYPAGCKDAISVASTTRNNTRATSSVVNESIFISAPADGIISTTLAGGYATVGGTSFAGPQVAAAAAIAKQICPDITPAQFKDALAATAYDLNTNVYGRDEEFGYGLLDLEKLVKYSVLLDSGYDSLSSQELPAYIAALNNKQVYISSLDATTTSLSIYNLTDSDFSFSSIYASQLGNLMTDYDHIPMTLKPGEKYCHTFTTEKTYNKLSHFIWKSLKSASPIEDYIPQRLIKN